MDDFAPSMMPPLLATFALSYGRIAVTMKARFTGNLLGRMRMDHDLVVAVHPLGPCESGELLRRERALWAASAFHTAEELDPLPVALYPTGCLFRKWALAALKKANRALQLAFVGHSSAVVETVVAQGLAATVMESPAFCAGLRQLSKACDPTSLPQAGIRLHRAGKHLGCRRVVRDLHDSGKSEVKRFICYRIESAPALAVLRVLHATACAPLQAPTRRRARRQELHA